MTPEEMEAERRRKMAEALTAQAQPVAPAPVAPVAPVAPAPTAPGQQPGGALAQGLSRFNDNVVSKGPAGNAPRATEDLIAVSESLVNGSPREVLTGTPEKTGAITQTGANIITAGLAPKFSAKAGNFAQGIDQTTRDFFKKLDPTNTKIQRADTSGVDAAQGNVQSAADRAGAMAAAVAGNPIQANSVTVADPGAAALTDRQAGITAGQVLSRDVQAQQAQAQQMNAAQVAALQQMQTAQIARGEDQQVRTDQIGLAQALQAQASGTGPSVAEAQLQRQNENAIRAQSAIAASARGGNVAMAQRQAAQNIAGLQAEAGAQAAALRIQEQSVARDQLRGVLGDTRQTDAAIATQQAQLGQETGKINVTLDAQKSFADALAAQEAGKVNATLGTDVNKFNAGQTLAADTTSAELALRAAQSNQSTDLDAQKATALNNISTDQFNAKAQDEMARFKTDANLRADVANQAADLQAQGMTVDSIAKFMGLEQQSLAAILQAETEAVQGEQDVLSAEKKAQSGMGGSILGSVGKIIAMCFPGGTLVQLMAGGAKPIEEIDIGDFVKGGAVLGVRKTLVNERLYNVEGVLMTGSHAVYEGGKAVYAKDAGEPAHVHIGLVYNIVTSTHRMWVNGVELGDDTIEAGGAQCH